MIYHLDVGAMYPNIILTNRLQVYTHCMCFLTFSIFEGHTGDLLVYTVLVYKLRDLLLIHVHLLEDCILCYTIYTLISK